MAVQCLKCGADSERQQICRCDRVELDALKAICEEMGKVLEDYVGVVSVDWDPGKWGGVVDRGAPAREVLAKFEEWKRGKA